MKPTPMLLKNNIPFVFVVPPKEIFWSYATNDKAIEIIDVGVIQKAGKRMPITVSWSSFFPSLTSNFFSLLNPLPSGSAINYLDTEMRNGTVFKLIIPENVEYLKCRITSFVMSHKDHTGDCYYSVTFTEERDDASNLADALTGLLERGR